MALTKAEEQAQRAEEADLKRLQRMEADRQALLEKIEQRRQKKLDGVREAIAKREQTIAEKQKIIDQLQEYIVKTNDEILTLRGQLEFDVTDDNPNDED